MTHRVLLTILLSVTACKQSQTAPPPAPAQPVVKPAPATPLSEKKDELGTENAWTPAWDAFIEKNLPPEMLSTKAAKAVASYCPAFSAASEADKRAFWAYTIQAMAAAEAGLKPEATARHTQPAVAKTDKVTHRPMRQEGLLQLSYQDGQTYGCDFDWQADSRLGLKDPARTILQPERNLACGIRILKTQIIDQDKPLLSRSSYWSTLQPGTQSYRIFAKQMANVPPSCGKQIPKSAGRSKATRPAQR
ncbi:hypothetical protein [Terriglobus albidus]|uniref:hypothetical protein n=1 Tax=Terriglobus albidus TaxID=1592106 RepID=UPI0021E03929|nr:hypothetical protein [Terriglobus albidus]